jgi:hypothetical protein
MLLAGTMPALLGNVEWILSCQDVFSWHHAGVTGVRLLDLDASLRWHDNAARHY